jgi:hypothetical protein
MKIPSIDKQFRINIEKTTRNYKRIKISFINLNISLKIDAPLKKKGMKKSECEIRKKIIL